MSNDQVKVADVTTGELLAGFPVRTDHFDIDEKGNVIGFGDSGLVSFSLADTPRVIAPRAFVFSVAAAGGRVAYISRDRLVLATLDGKVLRRLERYGTHRRPVGEIALSDQRVAWSVRSGRRGSVRAAGL